MNEQAHQYVEDFMAQLILRNPNEPEFHQAVREVAESLAPHIVASPVLQKMKVLERIAEPERVIIFRVPWLNDKGEIEINRGYRVQMNSAIGPYKGGIRFHPSVNLVDPEVPRLRTDLQEQPHDAADGRRQGRFGLQPQGHARTTR